jgi:hypothetical protein
VRLAFLWLEAFALTCAVEAPIAAPLLRCAEPRLARRLLTVLVANLTTHPLVWFFFVRLGLPYWQGATAGELWAFGFEIVVYRLALETATWRRCALVSVLANGASMTVGLILVSLGLLR